MDLSARFQEQREAPWLAGDSTCQRRGRQSLGSSYVDRIVSRRCAAIPVKSVRPLAVEYSFQNLPPGESCAFQEASFRLVFFCLRGVERVSHPPESSGSPPGRSLSGSDSGIKDCVVLFSTQEVSFESDSEEGSHSPFTHFAR